MAKRNRVRARARPTVPAQRPERVDADDRAERTDRPRTRYRGAPVPLGGGRAVGEPSPALERAAELERRYVVKDFGRLGKVVAVMLALLIVGGFATSSLIR